MVQFQALKIHSTQPMLAGLIAEHSFAPVNKSCQKHSQSSDQGISTARDHFQGLE